MDFMDYFKNFSSIEGGWPRYVESKQEIAPVSYDKVSFSEIFQNNSDVSSVQEKNQSMDMNKYVGYNPKAESIKYKMSNIVDKVSSTYESVKNSVVHKMDGFAHKAFSAYGVVGSATINSDRFPLKYLTSD